MSEVRIVLTGAATESREFAARIKDLGCIVDIVPTIRIKRLSLNAASKRIIENADSYDYVLFTSAHAVQFFIDLFRERWVKLPAHPRVLAVGTATAKAATEAGLKVRVVSKKPGARELAKQLKNIRGKRVLFPRSAIAASDVVELLRTKGAIVDVVALYTTSAVSVPTLKLATLFERKPTALVFLSPSSVESFSKNLKGAILRKRAFGTKVLAIGPTTAQAASKAGFQHIKIAKPSTTDGVITSISTLY